MADPSSEKPAGQGLTPRAAAGETCCSEHDPSQSAGSSQSGDPTDPRNPRPISYQTGSGERCMRFNKFGSATGL